VIFYNTGDRLDAKEYLTDWLEKLIKSKDVFHKTIVSIEKKDYGLYVKHKGKEKMFFVEAFVSNFSGLLKVLKKNSGNKWVSLVVVNNKGNFKLIIKNWKQLVGLGPQFSIYFVNPFSLLDKKWIIFPSTHHKIADSESFEKGLKSMFSMVDGIGEKDFEKSINNT
tara:strand:+ start:15543 stop:16040 length:498 start_codon:yes stop_codon:yes gene_type:complete